MPWPFTSRPAVAGPNPVTSDIAPGGCTDLDQMGVNIMVEFVRSIYLWRCIDMIGAMSASVPLIIVKDDESQLAGSQQNVLELLARPNPQWTGAHLQYFCSAWIAV